MNKDTYPFQNQNKSNKSQRHQGLSEIDFRQQIAITNLEHEVKALQRIIKAQGEKLKEVRQLRVTQATHSVVIGIFTAVVTGIIGYFVWTRMEMYDKEVIQAPQKEIKAENGNYSRS